MGKADGMSADFPDLEPVAAAFDVRGTLLESAPHGSGHINDTFVAVFSQAGARVRYIFQRINHRIFQDPVALMDNILRVTEASWERLRREGDVADVSRRTLRVIPTRAGAPVHRDAGGGWWRCYPFIEGARTYDIVKDAGQAFEAARAFGRFQALASALEGPRLHETIPGFHDTRRRFDRLREAVEKDACGRLRDVGPEWDFYRRREDLVDVLLDLQRRGEARERVTHNDTKLNNVMIDDATGMGICVIDLDTVMPGLSLYDFGDMVRTATSPAAEDERDLSRVRMQMPMFEALTRGYLASAGEFLNEAERAHLVFGGKLITLEIGIRFLTDYLEGDVYFRTHRPGHNLDRTRTQIALVASIEAQEDAMRAVVRAAEKDL